MSDEFSVVVTGLVTNKGEILIGKKEEVEDHPMSGQWHLPGGYLEKDDELQEKVVEKIKEKTGLEVDVHQLIDVYYDETGDILRAVFHCESEGRDAEAGGNLEEVKWIKPANTGSKLGELETEVLLGREDVLKFLDKLEKMPVF
jgi:ADP-ribose pyrophosphatase YjhB (NUDIX family)